MTVQDNKIRFNFMHDVSEFRKQKELKVFDIGTKVLKDGINGIIKEIIFARCYWVEWEDGQKNHVYHNEVAVSPTMN